MRLLIAGTLTLVIYLMACAYGNKEKKATEIKYTQTSTPLFWLPSHERYSPLPFVMFYFHNMKCPHFIVMIRKFIFLEQINFQTFVFV